MSSWVFLSGATERMHISLKTYQLSTHNNIIDHGMHSMGSVCFVGFFKRVLLELSLHTPLSFECAHSFTCFHESFWIKTYQLAAHAYRMRYTFHITSMSFFCFVCVSSFVPMNVLLKIYHFSAHPNRMRHAFLASIVLFVSKSVFAYCSHIIWNA